MSATSKHQLQAETLFTYGNRIILIPSSSSSFNSFILLPVELFSKLAAPAATPPPTLESSSPSISVPSPSSISISIALSHAPIVGIPPVVLVIPPLAPTIPPIAISRVNQVIWDERIEMNAPWKQEQNEMLLLLLPLVNLSSMKKFLLPFSKDNSSGCAGDETLCPICQANPTTVYLTLHCQHRNECQGLHRNMT
ncbi:hypothetical protein Lser_V15G05361 [Lactuca serriola]